MDFRIVISGPESTGKSVLTEKLTGHFGGRAVPEYARGYIAGLGRPYTERDVEVIARKQIVQFKESKYPNEIVFFDTGLIITKVWLELVFKADTDWIAREIRTVETDLYLLCAPDIPWIPDPLRENGGEMRYRLFEIYKSNLETFELPYRIIRGEGEDRFRNAIFAVKDLINKASS
jgi:nicotinamide riboside kinase